LRGDGGVEAQAWPGSVAEGDRAELVGVFVHPSAGEAELFCELARVEQPATALREGSALAVA
jgi:hypothetical protein